MRYLEGSAAVAGTGNDFGELPPNCNGWQVMFGLVYLDRVVQFRVNLKIVARHRLLQETCS